MYRLFHYNIKLIFIINPIDYQIYLENLEFRNC